MANVDWTRVKACFAEAMELEGGARTTFLKQLHGEDEQLAREVETLLAAHQSAEGAGFLDGLLGKGLGAEESLAELNPPSPADAAGDPINEETLIDPRHQQPASHASDHSTVAYDPASTKPDGEEGVPDVTLQATDITPPPSDPTLGPPTSRKTQSGDAPKFITDDYEVLDELGAGGMGMVYRAYQHSLRRHVALKIIPTRLLRSSEQVARFYLEAEAAAGLDHPGIVPVQDVGEHDGVHYYAMALVEGGSLADYVGRGDRLPVRRAAEVMQHVCRAVQYAHDHAVIHRDIKPANIMLDKSGQPRLCDFGLAKITDEDDGLTVTGQVMGTPSYMAPEQAEGKSHAISNRTDVYSLGATLYALLAGRPPFRGETVLTTLKQVQTAAPEPLAATTPIDLRTICEKCLAKQPADRYPSAGALADDLQRYLDGYPISARPLGRWQRLVRWRRRNPLLATMLGAIAVTLVAATVISTIFGIEARRQAAAAAKALTQSEANARKLGQAIEETFIFASEDLLAQEPGMQAARRTLLESAERYYRELMATGQGSPQKLADAAFMLGRVQASLGESQPAAESFAQAIALQTSLIEADENPAADAMLALAQTHNEFARLGKTNWHSRQIDEPTDDARRGLATWLEHAKACARWRSAAALEKPADVQTNRLHANALMNYALAQIEQAANTPSPGDIAAIESLITQAQAIRTKLLSADTGADAVQRDYALGLASLADLRSLQGDRANDTDAARQQWRRSLELREQAADQLASLPTTVRSQDSDWKLAVTHQLCAEQHYQLGEVRKAIAAFGEMRSVMARLLLRNPGVGRFRTGMAESLFNLAQLTYASGDADGGGVLFADCQDVLVEGVAIRPEGDSLPQLVEFTRSMAASLAEHVDLRQQAVGLLQRASQQLGELSIASQHQPLIDAAKQKLLASADAIRAKGDGDDST
ncbi:MAG: serine/threonine-protein kinase [Planctomycetota bacterium]